jgi:hypothetical protein
MPRTILFVILLFALFSVCVLDSRARHFKPDSKSGVGPPATYHLTTASRKTRLNQYPQQPSVHERFATFLVGDGFKSTLLLENFRLDVPITVTPTLILGAGEVPMDPVVLAPHSAATVDISGFLQARGYPDKQGTAVVRYTFSSYGPINAAVESTDEAHYLYLNSYAASPEEYWSGTAFDAVVWTPQEGTQDLSPSLTHRLDHVLYVPLSLSMATWKNGQSRSLLGTPAFCPLMILSPGAKRLERAST